MAFEGKRVLALESRRAAETAELIRKAGGNAFVAPSMREVPLEQNVEALEFLSDLLRGRFDMVILLTGVGTRFLAKVAAQRHTVEEFADALRRVTTVARGPKPVAALRELGLDATIRVPEPNTWHEILKAIEGRTERRIAVQEYGKPNPELTAALRERGAEVTTVPVYQWELPEDTGPLREAVQRLARREFDVVLFTTSTQVDHLLRVAADLRLETKTLDGLRSARIVSIGPTTTETLQEHGLQPALEPSHPKLGLLVKEASELP